MKKAVIIKAIQNDDSTSNNIELLVGLNREYDELIVLLSKEGIRCERIDKFVFFDKDVLLIDKEEKMLAGFLGTSWYYNSRVHNFSRLEDHRIIEISKLNDDTYQIYIFLLQFLRICNGRDEAYGYGLDQGKNTNKDCTLAEHDLWLLGAGRCFTDYFYKDPFFKNFSLVDGIENLNANNPVRYYLDDVLGTTHINLFECKAKFNIFGSSQILLDAVSDYYNDKEGITVFYKKSKTYRGSFFPLNYEIEMMDYACRFQNYMRVKYSDITVGIGSINDVLHISYEVNSSKKIDMDLLSTEMKNNSLLNIERVKGFVCEKIVDGIDITFGQVMNEVCETIDDLIKILSNAELYIEEEESYEYDEERWSMSDVAEYYGYSSVEDYENS